MPISTANLLLQGTLFLSASHPAQIRGHGNSVWFSKPKIVEAQGLGSQLILKSQSIGLVHMAHQGSETPLRVQSVSDDTYRAIQKCPAAPLDWSQSPPVPIKPESLNSLSDCGFEALALPEPMPPAWLQEMENMESRLSAGGVRVQDISSVNGHRKIRISGKKGEQEARLKRILGAWRSFYETEYVAGPRPGRTLVFEVSLFEFSRSKATALGVRWPQSVSFKSLENGRWKMGGTGGGALEIGADFGESLGIGRVLARPQIRTKPGEKATFQSGGEIPIRNTSAYASQTTWKNYGLMLTLEPEAEVETGASEITVGFKLELSEPDPSSAIDGVPGMRVRRLESRFDLRSDELTILTTLIQTRLGSQQAGLRGSGQIPLLQTLFGHKDSSAQDSELWFAIRPTWEEINAPR